MARGALAEWLGKGLQNLLHRFKSGTRLHKNTQLPWASGGIGIHDGLKIRFL